MSAAEHRGGAARRGGSAGAAGRRRLPARTRVAVGFLAPAAILLGVWIVYPTIYTIVRSFFGRDGFGDFVGFDNYKALFTTTSLLTAIKNNAIWVAVVPGARHRDRPRSSRC